jgi:DNA-binding transcriptional LysR family regulator
MQPLAGPAKDAVQSDRTSPPAARGTSRIELHRLRYFVAVAEELNFGRAARRLNIAQPPLSQQISKLEDELGVRLFERNRRHVALTFAGSLFLEEVRRTLVQAAHAIDVARRASRGELGMLAIGCGPMADLSVLPMLLPRLRARHPDITLRFTALSEPDLTHALRKGVIDACFLHLPIADAEALEVVQLIDEDLVAALPERDPLASRPVLTISELAHLRVLLAPRSHAPDRFDAIVRAIARANPKPDIGEVAEQISFVLSLVAMGEGVALFASGIRQFARDGVVYVPIEADGVRSSIGMVSREHDPSPALAKLREVVDVAFKGGLQ